MSDDAARTADGRLFHARGAATENDRSPRVDSLTGDNGKRLQSELLWLTSAGDGGPRRQLPAVYTVSEVGRSCAVETAEHKDWHQSQHCMQYILNQ